MMFTLPEPPDFPPNVDDCTHKECRDDRYEKQARESRRVLSESASILKQVSETLERAARELGEYGDYPFKDLERRK